MTNRELDEFILANVLEWTLFKSSFEQYEPSVWKDKAGKTVKIGIHCSPSEDIEVAWEVVEKLSPRIIVGPSPWKKSKYAATYNAYDGYADGFDWVEADTAPMAICLAAKLAIEAG